MANPPFSGEIKDSQIITKYELGKNNGKFQSKVKSVILFIERNLNFLKSGGRMAIILPQGILNNSSDKYIRDFIANRCRILAIVGLHGNVFKPHTGTKTSVLFVQKWDEKLCPRREDYPIFFATMREPSKDNSGEKIFEFANGELLRDSHNHTIVKHDLFNHDGKTRDGIAEAFIEFAKREGLSFFEQSSFDAAKYKILSEELECTEVFLSNLERTNRIDAEFYSKENQNLLSTLKKHELKKITEFVLVSDGNHMSISENFHFEGIPYYRGQDIHNFFIESSNCICIDEKTFNLQNMKRSHLKKNDILLSIVATIGEVSIVTSDKKATCNCKLAILRPREKYSAELLSMYLKSKYGYSQIQKFKRGTVQMGFLLEDMNQLVIPAFGKDFQSIIKENVQSAFKLSERADENYHATEKMLSEALGLDNFNPSSENVAIKSFSASFGFSGRLDAEFYQSKYDDWKNLMTIAGTVGELCKVHDKNFIPNPKTIYKYIELANVELNGNISTPDNILGEELPTRARRIVKSGQVIISSIEGSLQNCALITEENDGALCSTGFFVVDSKNFNSETL